MFGIVFRAFLLAVAISRALVMTNDAVEYSPWCIYKVQAQFTVLTPRQSPCQRHKRFDSSRLYLTLLLLLSGDIELNPGPEGTGVHLTDNDKSEEETDGTCKICAACNMPIVKLQLRSRAIVNTQIRCSVDECDSVVHYRCLPTESDETTTHWVCSKHISTDARVDCSPTRAQQSASAHSESIGDSTTVPGVGTMGESANEEQEACSSIAQPKQPSKQSPSLKESSQRQTGDSERETIPGPSFVSANLMDVMEALRLTQLKIDKLADDIQQMREEFRATLRQEARRAESLPHQSPPSPDTLPPSSTVDQRPSSVPAPAVLWQPAVPRHLACRQPSAQPRPTPNRASQPELRDDGREGNHHTREPSVLIVGDSNVRRLQTASRHSHVTFRSIPGATTDRISQELSQSVREVNPAQVVLHIGTNDIARNGSELIAKNIFQLATRTKEQRGVQKVCICSIPPRKDRGSFLFSRCESVNNRLYYLCSKATSVEFIDLREQLDSCPFSGLARDSIHYNQAGASQALRTIRDTIDGFLE